MAGRKVHWGDDAGVPICKAANASLVSDPEQVTCANCQNWLHGQMILDADGRLLKPSAGYLRFEALERCEPHMPSAAAIRVAIAELADGAKRLDHSQGNDVRRVVLWLSALVELLPPEAPTPPIRRGGFLPCS